MTTPSRFKRASDLSPPQFIKTRNHSIDHILGGGFRTGVTHEVFGESNVGKTQLALQLAVTVQLKPNDGGLYGSAVYIHTDYAFPARRMKQLVDEMQKQLLVDEDTVSMDNVSVAPMENMNELLRKIDEVEQLCSRQATTCRHVKLIIIDSIGSLCRSQFHCTGGDMSRRAKLLTRLSVMLGNISHNYNVATLITNQVADNIGGETITMNHVVLRSSNRVVKPTLGLVWANCINNRLFMSFDSPTGAPTRRKLQIIFSPYLPQGECMYDITREEITEWNQEEEN